MKKAGFTWLEVAIVIAILGLLVAIALPSFIDAKKRAESPNNLLEVKVGEINDYEIYRFRDRGGEHYVAVPKKELEKP